MPLDESIFTGSRLIVVGNVNRDVKIAPIAPGTHLFADGETSTDSIRETIGGGAANSALAAAALGANVTLIAKVGVDSVGERVERTLACRSVQSALIRDPSNPTGTSINLVWTTGQRHFVSCLPSADLSFEQIESSKLQGCDHLLRADPWFSDHMLSGGNEKLLRAARDMGLATSLDINWDPMWGRAPVEVISKRKSAIRAVLPLVNLVHGNVKELCTFAETDNLELALSRIVDWGAESIIVHMGAQGGGYFDASKQLIVEPTAPVDAIVNATGSGDVLSICMILMHRHGHVAVTDKLRLANRVVSEYIAGYRNLVPELLA